MAHVALAENQVADSVDIASRIRALRGRPLPGRWSVVTVSFNFLSNLLNIHNFQLLLRNSLINYFAP